MMNKSPYSFKDCHICTVARRAEQAGRSLSYEELAAAFEAQENKHRPETVEPEPQKADSGSLDGKPDDQNRA
jgi:hypothetical protein